MNKEKIEKILLGVLAILMVAYFAYSMITDPFKHIDDRNGNNTDIATITNSEIIDYGNSRSGGMARSKSDLVIAGIQFGGIKFHSNKFSGVEPLLRTDVLFGDILLNIYNLEVNEGNFRLYVLNESGMKYRTINLRAELNHNVIPPTIKITTETPIYKIGNVLYLCGSINEEIEDLDSIYGLLVTKISSHDDFSNPVLNIGYPSSYRKGNWGDAYFRNVCWCYNSKEHAFYLSFANDHYIYKYDKSMEMVDKIYAGSAFADDICSIDHPQNIPLPKSKRIAHYLSSFYYRGIIYDKYNDVYYRILEHPWENFNPNERPWKKPISIAVFNSDFKYLGEKLLSEEYNLSVDNIFVSKEGLFIRKETDCEDELIYSIFRLNKIY